MIEAAVRRERKLVERRLFHAQPRVNCAPETCELCELFVVVRKRCCGELVPARAPQKNRRSEHLGIIRRGHAGVPEEDHVHMHLAEGAEVTVRRREWVDRLGQRHSLRPLRPDAIPIVGVAMGVVPAGHARRRSAGGAAPPPPLSQPSIVALTARGQSRARDDRPQLLPRDRPAYPVGRALTIRRDRGRSVATVCRACLAGRS